MDALLNTLNLDETENDASQQEKQKTKKKKMSAAMIKKMQAKLAEEARHQLIKQKQEFLKETKKRVQMEWDRNHEKALVYESEYQKRLNELVFPFEILSEIEKKWKEHLEELKKNEEWLEYMDCGYLPNPLSIPEMNAYIYVWTEVENFCDMSYCIKKTNEVMKLLNGLDELINHPRPGCPPKSIADMKELRSLLRKLLQDQIDRATFYLFSRIETDMMPVNVTTSKYFAQCSHFLMSLWAELITPIPSTRGKEVRHPLKVSFEETEVNVVVPVSLLDTHKVMRAMWLKYDHWSDSCRTYDCPPLPRYYHENLLELIESEFGTKEEIMNGREILEILMKKKIAAIPAEPTLSQEILAWDAEPQRALSEEVAFRKCEEEDNLGKQVKAMLNEFEVNLRERTILGDLLLLEVLHQPPQPKYLRFKHSVTLRRETPKLHQVDFYVKYPPPPPEEIESEGEEENEQKPKASLHNIGSRLDLGEEIKKLMIIQLKPCQRVVWFENPEIANWDTTHGYWSREDIHDITYDEEDGTITFKTGRMGLMSLHVTRYSNLPYLDWVFERGEEEGNLNFHLKTSRAELHFKIRECEVCLESMKDVPSKAMNWILGTYYSPNKLLELLKEGGIDVCPAPDAVAYVEHIQPKPFVIENHIYQVWGLFSRSFRFKCSKFNQVAGRSTAVFQAQEIYENHQVDFCLIQSSMSASYVLDINEESENYSSERAPYMENYVDLYTLLYHNCTRQAIRESEVTSYLLVQTVKEFLSFIRPISFS